MNLNFLQGQGGSGCLSFSRATSSHPFFEGKVLGTRLSLGSPLGGSNLTPDPFVVVLGDCVQCTGYLPQCNLPGLFGFPKCTMSFEKCKFNKPRPFRSGILQLETDCY